MIHSLSKLNDPARAGELAISVAGFLQRYGTEALMGPSCSIWEGVLPENRFDALITHCGYKADAHGFLGAVYRKILESCTVSFNGTDLPMLLLYHILEAAAPGEILYAVHSPAQLERRAGVVAADPAAMEAVIATYPVRLSSHVIRQSKVSRAVALQYLPFEGELDPTGHELTFDGHFKQGLMEQMYRNRAIFLLDMRCPVYCRFCFRKHKSLRKEASPGVNDVKEALERVRRNQEIREILITGGEPLLNRRNMETAVLGLLKIDHVKTLRIATRSLAYYPHLFRHHDGRVMAELKSWQARCRSVGKRLEIGIHMLHPDEISIQALEIISELTEAGISVYLQTPFLAEVNHEGRVLGELFTRLRQAGAEIYYIFTPCHPIHGTRKYWSPIRLSLDAYAFLRANVSDRCLPKLCTATPLGKMEWHTSGWAVEKDGSDPDHIWIRTPYTQAYFDPMMKGAALPVATRENKYGTLDAKCLVDMGDPALFHGDSGPFGPADGVADRGISGPGARTEEIQAWFFRPEPPMTLRAEPAVDTLVRVHKTRVILNLRPGEGIQDAALAFIQACRDITDVVIRVPARPGTSIDSQMDDVEAAVNPLSRLDRYLCIRLMWAAVHTAPAVILPDHIQRLRRLSRFDIARPFGLEIETWWLVPDQINADHCRLFGQLRDAGIRTYANTALILGLNTDPAVAEALACRIREGNMEFHQVYTDGLSVQDRFNRKVSVPKGDVLSVASRVRMNCTGREVPLYVAWTPEGERDFGL